MKIDIDAKMKKALEKVEKGKWQGRLIFQKEKHLKA